MSTAHILLTEEKSGSKKVFTGTGVQFGDTATNQALYESFFAAWAPLLSQQGRMVVLTADQEALNGALKDAPASQRRLRLDRKLRVRVKGIWAEIALLKL